MIQARKEKITKEQIEWINEMFSTKWVSHDGKELTKEMYIEIFLNSKRKRKIDNLHFKRLKKTTQKRAAH